MTTENQISALRAEARNAGDIVQVVMCDVALDEVDHDADCTDADGLPDYSGGGHSAREVEQIRRWLRSSQEDAWAECVRVIEAGQG